MSRALREYGHLGHLIQRGSRPRGLTTSPAERAAFHDLLANVDALWSDA